MFTKLNRSIAIIVLSFSFLTSESFASDVLKEADAAKQSSDLPSIRYKVNDSHLHYVNFVQETDGIEALIAAMDRLGVEHTMLSGVPVVKKWDASNPDRPTYYLDNDSRAYYYSLTDIILARAVTTLSSEKRQRIHPFMCGFNPTDRNAIDHVNRMLEWYPDLWEGIGEIFTHHDDLSAYTEGEQARPDHITLDPIYDLAAENDLPISLHSNIGSVGQKEPLYLHELENALNKHPNTRFIWAHSGLGREVMNDDIININNRLLTTYRNLWIDLSGRFYEKNVMIDGELSKKWTALIEQFPDRFMLGTDKLGRFTEEYQVRVLRYYPLLDALSSRTRDMVARANFLSVLPGKVREKLKTGN